jgi:hypothetical protein
MKIDVNDIFPDVHADASYELAGKIADFIRPMQFAAETEGLL